MNAKLTRTCFSAWILGLAGMIASRVFFDLGTDALAFELAARVWIVGGLGYLFVGLLAFACENQAAGRTRSGADPEVDRVHQLDRAAEDHALRVHLAPRQR